MNREAECCCSGLPLAIATVPPQQFRQLYDPATALLRGTLFRELDLPFYGKRGGEQDDC